MAIVSLTTIKNWFKTGLKPTQAQFWDVWDSFRHKSESVPYESIEGLDAVLLAQDVKINAIALPDDVIKEGEVIVTGTTVDILAEDFIWRLLQVQYTNAAAYNTVLPFATSGYIRTDIFVGTNLGTIYRVPGDEGVGVALKPSAPTGTIELASIDVESTVVGTPVIPKPRWAVSQQLRNGETGYAPSENVVFDALALKIDAADYNNHSKGVYLTEAALNAAHPIASAGDSAQVNIVGSTDVVNYSWDAEENIWVNNGTGGSGAVNTDALPEGSTNLYFTVGRFLANLTYANVIAALGFTPSTAPNDAQKNSNITKAEIEAKLIGEITTHTHPAVGGGGDMVLASAQTVLGLKTFLTGMFGLRNVANTFTSFFTNANTASRTYTLQNRDGTILDNTDLTAINTSIAGKMANPTGGIANYLPKFLTGTTQGLSRLWDNGSFLGIGTVSAPTKDLTFGNQASREIGIEESLNTSMGKDLIIRAGRTINYVNNTNFVSLNQDGQWVDVKTHPDGTIYGLKNGNGYGLHKKSTVTDVFTQIIGLPGYNPVMSIAPDGTFYFGNSDGSTVVKISTNGGYNFSSIPSETLKNVTSLCSISNGNTYAVSGNKIYMRTGNTGVFQDTLEPIRPYNHLLAVGNNVYAFTTTAIFKQTNGTGAFVDLSQTSRNYNYGFVTIGGDVYASVGTSAYKQTGGSGNFLLDPSTTLKGGPITVAQNGDWYSIVYNTSIHKKQNDGVGTANLDGGTFKIVAGTGKGTGTSRIEWYTGQKTASGTNMQIETLREYVDENGYHIYVSMPVYADNAAAVIGGLPVGCEYRTATGVKMIVY